MSWGGMDTSFVRSIHEHIYAAEVNAVIPWAGIQNPSAWIGGDPNPGMAIMARDDGSCELMPGYFLYKQLTRAGRRGMAVADTMVANPVSNLIALSSNGTAHPDAFVVVSRIPIWKLPFKIDLRGTKYRQFRAYRTTEDGREKYKNQGLFSVRDGSIIYDAPTGSVTTFIGADQ